MEMRSVFTQLPEMLVCRNRVSGLWKAVCVEPGSCEQGEDDGEGV